MHFIDTLTILCTGLMVGNELAVSLFVNPAVWQLDEHAQAKAASLLARSLGKFMPFWYALCAILLLAETYVHRHQPAIHLLVAAVAVWAAVVAYTIVALVPINNRIAKLALIGLPPRWRQDHKKWDNRHRLRIVLLIIAIACSTFALLSA
jgi:uncharacterized membrane protein